MACEVYLHLSPAMNVGSVNFPWIFRNIRVAKVPLFISTFNKLISIVTLKGLGVNSISGQERA